ncbi:hypothetical protein Hamer_G007567 [Homarus americanus]|uniref:Uncharacterized protein n=1 Tax=Homarus americanus TaxID=6706 RepID=A0A8J5JVL0_HOMAM|nr:hypothetical protein Hamer_G007567 [Homarus americanus]
MEEEGQAKPVNVSMSLTNPPNSVTVPAAVPTAEIKVINGKKSIMVKALFDTGAQKTFIWGDAARALQLPTKK